MDRRGARTAAGLALAAAALAAPAIPAQAQPALPNPSLPSLSGEGGVSAGSGASGSGSTFLEGRTGGALGSPIAPGFDGLGGFAGIGAGTGLGYPFGLGPGQPAGPPRAWTITPSLGVSFLGSDNINGTATNRQADLLTRISPAIAAQANTRSLTGQLFFSPSARFYAETRGQNGVDFLFNGQGLATLVEDKLFLDLRGFGGLQSLGGGYAPDGIGQTNRANQVQTAYLSASPYYVHRFANTARAQVGYNYTYSTTTGQNAFLPGFSQPFFTNQYTTSNIGYAVLRSGEAFGRFEAEWRTNGAVFSGNGVLSGAHRVLSSVQGRYSIRNDLAVLLEGGYEDLKYGGTNPFTYSGPVWTVGVRLQPNQDSIIIAKYGKRDGFNSAYLNANVFVGGRTNLFATYSEILGSYLLQAQDLLSTTQVDALGNLVDSTSGAPIVPPFGGSLLASQNTLFRTKRGTVGITQTWQRDAITLSGYYQDNIPVSSQIGTIGFAQKGYYVGLNWSRALSPILTGNIGGQYGWTDSAQYGNGNFYSGSVGLSRTLAPGLLGNLQYFYRNSNNGVIGTNTAVVQTGHVVVNTVLLSLRQTF